EYLVKRVGIPQKSRSGYNQSLHRLSALRLPSIMHFEGEPERSRCRWGYVKIVFSNYFSMQYPNICCGLEEASRRRVESRPPGYRPWAADPNLEEELSSNEEDEDDAIKPPPLNPLQSLEAAVDAEYPALEETVEDEEYEEE
ncbi:hypothetical protein PENTCL1PPCAC_12511, partial [Pristionchus entomophagus]